MNTTHVFGGALINTSITPVSDQTPHDPNVEASIAAFLAVMNKAYACGMEHQFRLVQEIFLDEMDQLIDDKRLGAQLVEEPHSDPNASVEALMDHFHKKRKK